MTIFGTVRKPQEPVMTTRSVPETADELHRYFDLPDLTDTHRLTAIKQFMRTVRTEQEFDAAEELIGTLAFEKDMDGLTVIDRAILDNIAQLTGCAQIGNPRMRIDMIMQRWQIDPQVAELLIAFLLTKPAHQVVLRRYRDALKHTARAGHKPTRAELDCFIQKFLTSGSTEVSDLYTVLELQKERDAL